MKPLIILAAILVGAFRPVLLFREFNPHVESGYQAIAHILVGLLLGAWYATKLGQQEVWKIGGRGDSLGPAARAWLLKTFWLLTAIEVICAGITIYRKLNP